MSELRALERRYRILVVDDDAQVRQALLADLGPNFEVTAVASGAEALAQLGPDHFDAMIANEFLPEMSGLGLLNEALERDPNLIRIVLTGPDHDDARRAMMAANAPYQIRKPWHDDIEVTLRRALENRERERDLKGSVSDALAIGGIDDELATVDGDSALARILVRRCQSLARVEACEVRIKDEHQERMLAGTPIGSDIAEGSWVIDTPICVDGRLHLLVRGSGETSRNIIDYLAVRALHWSSEDTATRLAKRANSDPAAQQLLSAMSRRATLGTMTVALVHELASMVQSIQGGVFELEDFIRDTADEHEAPEILEALHNTIFTSTQMVALFRSMRTFARTGDAAHRPCRVVDLVERSVALCQSSLRAAVDLRVGPLPDEEVDANEALFMQVLVNLLRNAAEASPLNGTVNLDVQRLGTSLIFSVRDHGEGVPEDLIEEVFEPFSSTKTDHDASGLGLAISSEIVAEHGGHIRYRRATGGGALFTVTVPVLA